MTTEEKLKICKICQNKSFSNEKGLICGLTNEKPDFENECPHFILNPNEVSSSSPNMIDEELSTGLKVLSFCIPLAGFIIYLVNSKSQPTKAKQACSLAWYGVLLSVIINIIVAIAQGNL